MTKADIKDAFPLIPIKVFPDQVFPMGSAISCQTFERFRWAVQWILLQHFAVDSVKYLLGDFIFVNANDSYCRNYLDLTKVK